MSRAYPDDYAGQVAREQDVDCPCESGCALCDLRLARERRAEMRGDMRRDEWEES